MSFLDKWFGSPDEVRLTREELTEGFALAGATPEGIARLARQDSAELSRQAAEENKQADTTQAAVMEAYSKELRELQSRRDASLAKVAHTAFVRSKRPQGTGAGLARG